MNSNRIILLLVVSVSIVILIYAFTQTEQPKDEYSTNIHAQRVKKDRKFRASRNDSPLSEEQKKAFDGLNYFAPDPTYKVRADIEKLDDDSVYTFRTSQNTVRKMKKYGTLTFKIQGQLLSLVALRGLDPLTRRMLFVPFTDETSGVETYGAGRYIDLPVPETNQLTIDFNEAYNPYCAYNENYECPLPPPENHLKLRMEAGEKNFGKNK